MTTRSRSLLAPLALLGAFSLNGCFMGGFDTAGERSQRSSTRGIEAEQDTDTTSTGASTGASNDTESNDPANGQGSTARPVNTPPSETPSSSGQGTVQRATVPAGTTPEEPGGALRCDTAPVLSVRGRGVLSRSDDPSAAADATAMSCSSETGMVEVYATLDVAVKSAVALRSNVDVAIAEAGCGAARELACATDGCGAVTQLVRVLDPGRYTVVRRGPRTAPMTLEVEHVAVPSSVRVEALRMDAAMGYGLNTAGLSSAAATVTCEASGVAEALVLTRCPGAEPAGFTAEVARAENVVVGLHSATDPDAALCLRPTQYNDRSASYALPATSAMLVLTAASAEGTAGGTWVTLRPAAR